MDEKQKVIITTGSWVRGVVVVAIAYAFFLSSEFILIIIASIVIASAIEPATSWTKRRGIPRLPTVLLVYMGSALVLAGLFYFLLLPLIGEMSSFIKTLTIYSNSVVSGGILSDMFKTQNLIGVSRPPNRFWVLNISERIPPLTTELEYIVRVLIKLDISPIRGRRRT